MTLMIRKDSENGTSTPPKHVRAIMRQCRLTGLEKSHTRLLIALRDALAHLDAIRTRGQWAHGEYTSAVVRRVTTAIAIGERATT